MTVKRRRVLAVVAALVVIGLAAWLTLKGKDETREARPSAATPNEPAPVPIVGAAKAEKPAPMTTVHERPRQDILRWSDVPLRVALLPSGIAGGDEHTIAGDHSRLLAWIANQEIDFGIEPDSLVAM